MSFPKVAQADYCASKSALLYPNRTNKKMSSLGQRVAGVAHKINNPVNFYLASLNQS
ncbi:MAG TPA: hypothetical protein V6D11_06765 [Waterburya sp.]